MSVLPNAPAEPDRDCPACPRLVAFRARNRAAYPAFWNAPVPSWGPLDARLLIVGLAPGLKGANQTGRPFTGDYAGDLLYETLTAFGFARGRYTASPDDELRLIDCRITNAVRCVPPENKPVGAEVATCRRYLEGELGRLPNLQHVLALGQIAHKAVVAAVGDRQAAFPFGHGAVHRLGTGLILADSYHCSRYNTSTRRLTPAMFQDVFRDLRGRIDAADRHQQTAREPR